MPSKAARSRKNETGGSNPLERYFTILEILAALPDGATHTALATISGLPKPAIHRLVSSLTQAGLVELDDGHGKIYRLGTRMRGLAMLSLNDDLLTSAANLVLAPLARKLDETCFLVRLEGTVIRSCAMSAPARGYRLHIEPGFVIPAHAGATGKAILAFQPESVVRAVAAAPLERLTSRTHRTVDDLLVELQAIRTQGYAHCDGEIDENSAAYACPVYSAKGDVYFAIGVTGPRDRLHERDAKTYASALAHAAKKFQECLVRTASERISAG